MTIDIQVPSDAQERLEPCVNYVFTDTGKGNPQWVEVKPKRDPAKKPKPPTRDEALDALLRLYGNRANPGDRDIIAKYNESKGSQ